MVVQKVVGQRFGDTFFPFASGVMFSRNVYAWNPKIKKEEGLVRLVFGLGTRAVDRVGSDYPRMTPLSHPRAHDPRSQWIGSRSIPRSRSTSLT